MANPVLVMDYANMFCGSAPTDDKVSNHLTLREVQFPTIDIQYVDHRPGGAVAAIEIDMILARFEVKFELIGITRQVMEMLLRYDAFANDFYIYGNVRDQMSGAALQAEAYVRGQLGSVESSPFKRGELMTTRYGIRGIVAYRLSLDKSPIYDWNFFTNVWAVGGFNQSGAAT